MKYTPEQIADVLDFAILRPLAGIGDIRGGAIYCRKNGIKSICVASANVGIASQYHPNVSSVIAFPHGNVDPKAKLREAQRAIQFGARELDVVVNYGRFLDGDWKIIYRELQELCKAAHDEGALVKAILETCHYTTSELVVACHECVRAEVDFVKTSTGFAHQSATLFDVQTMLDAVRDSSVKVKASGGIKNYQDVVQYLDMGCKRLGTSRYQELLP
jgi:deoxyribose-phosphate aldolase